MAEKSQPSANYRTWPVILALAIVSLPLVLMYAYLFIDTVTDKQPASLIPERVHVSPLVVPLADAARPGPTSGW